jgi:hypothetical protein
MLAMFGLIPATTGQQSALAVSADAVKSVLAIQGRSLPDEEVEMIRRALQWNLDRFQRVRALELDDAVAPAVMFVPRRR